MSLRNLDMLLCLRQVVDLLVAMARAAVQSARKQLIFEPYPSVVDPNDKTRLAFSPEVCHLVESFTLNRGYV